MQDLISAYTFVRLIQEEKQSTEARAEELESRVGSLEHMNLLVRGRSFERSSPPLSGRSTPKSHLSPQRDYLHKYHTVSIILLLPCSCCSELLLVDLFHLPICTYCTFTLISVGNAGVNWFVDWLNVFILKCHHCALQIIRYLTEQYRIVFANTRGWSTVWSHVWDCVHSTGNVLFSGKKSGACNTF